MIEIFKSKKRLQETIKAQEEMIENLYTLLEECKNKPKRKKRKQLTHRTGYTKVGQVESYDIYEMYQNERPLVDIANHFSRSQSCISRHIRKHLEK